MRRGLEGLSRKWANIVRLDPCPYCGEGLASTIDHIYPIAKITQVGILCFGISNWQNLSGACESCNHEKAAKLLLYFLLERTNETKRPSNVAK